MSEGHSSVSEHAGKVAEQGAHGLLSVTNVAGVAAEEGGEFTSAGIKGMGRVGKAGIEVGARTAESGASVVGHRVGYYRRRSRGGGSSPR